MGFRKLFPVLQVLIVILIQSVITKDVYYHLTPRYMCGAPDGVTVDHILAFNGQFPGPTIEATIGDTLHITVQNHIQPGIVDRTTVHWHGIFQRGTPFEDGPENITQCPIPRGGTYTYTFKVEQAGSYWYHSHTQFQYTEGMLGPLIIHNKPEVYAKYYDDDIVITLSDWYHTNGLTNTDWFLSAASGGDEPIPFSILINGHGRFPCNSTKLPCDTRKMITPVFRVEYGKRYRFRVINTSAISKFFFSIPEHKLYTIETDGVDTVMVPFDRVPIAAAQRYSFIVEMNGNKQEYWIQAEVDLDMFNFDDPNINPNPGALIPVVKAKLRYVHTSNSHHKPKATQLVEQYPKLPSLVPPPVTPNEDGFPGEMLLQPYDKILAPNYFDKQILLNVGPVIDSEGVNHLAFNGIIYKIGNIPLLPLVLQNQPLPADANSFIVGFNQVAQIVLNNNDTGPHPFHLHGHTFWVLGVGATNAGEYNSARDKLVLNGVRRDTVIVQTKSWIVLRFIADNPGVWYFHCHINWHLQSGLAAVINEAPEVARRKLRVPRQTKKNCESVGVFLP